MPPGRRNIRGTDQVAVCKLGDGTTNIGAFHEALSMASIWKLPVVFVCENNLYMEYTPISEVTPVKNPAADRASAYGLDRILIDGNDADEVYRSAQSAIARARAGEGPSLIEALTYRHHGHSRADPAKYRPPEEVEAWMKRDPIPLYRRRLIDCGVAESGDPCLSKVEEKIKQAVDQATEVAKASRPPADELIYKDVWADGGMLAWQELTYRDAVAAGIAAGDGERDNSGRRVWASRPSRPRAVYSKATVGLLEKFGPRRVRDTPIAEQAILGAAMGAAMTGLGPVRRDHVLGFSWRCAGTSSRTRLPRRGI